MKRFVNLLLIALLLSSCGGRGKVSSALSGGEADTLALRYAENLTLTAHDGYTVARLRNPWDTLRTLHTYVLVPKEAPLPDQLPAGTVVRTPLSRAVIYSVVHCGLLQELGVAESIGGVCDLRYIKLPVVQEGCKQGRIVDCGNGLNPDMERIIDLNPDALLLSPFENSGGYGRVEKLEVPIIECADYMETSALGRAEWVRFYGLLFGAAESADSLFASVEGNYLRLKERARQSSASLSIINDMKYGSVWYISGGRSTMGRLFQDACGTYAFAGDPHSGSVPLSFEAVFDRAGESDVWIIRYNRDRDMTYKDLQTDYVGYAAFKAYKERNIYGCNTSTVPFYEEVPFHPDRLLSDLIQILHPDITDLGGLNYYRKLEE